MTIHTIEDNSVIATILIITMICFVIACSNESNRSTKSRREGSYQTIYARKKRDLWRCRRFERY